jgi:hypothetical protein
MGLVMLIVQQHEANGAIMDKAAGHEHELKSKMGNAASLLNSLHQGNGTKNVTF